MLTAGRLPPDSAELEAPERLIAGEHGTARIISNWDCQDVSGIMSNVLTAMADEDPELKAFNDFGIDEVTLLASISRRTLQRLEDIHNANVASLAI
jgi:hypothetical protein